MKSIIMSAPSVRSTLADLKTQTRRKVKPRPHPEITGFCEIVPGAVEWKPVWSSSGKSVRMLHSGESLAFNKTLRPRYAPGDIAYVKESWRMGGRGDFEWEEGVTPVDYQADGRTIFHDTDSLGLYPHGDPDADPKHWLPKRHEHHDDQARWRSPLFMPEWASRLKIEITSVRCERLQEISEEDALAEGIAERVLYMEQDDCQLQLYGLPEWGEDLWSTCPIEAYAQYWDSINGAGAWEEDPFVWVYGYRRVA